MIDYEKYEIRQILSSNYGTLSPSEYSRVVENAENEESYLMPGIQRIQYTTDGGSLDWARMDLNLKKEYWDSLADLPSFEEFMAS